MVDVPHLAVAGAAALAAGLVNAIAGGGSLVTFPALVALGLPPVAASVTNTVALCPGYLGATLAQRRDLVGQGKRIALVLPVAAVFGVAGALLLLETGNGMFAAIVPFLILLAAVMLGTQDWIKARVLGRSRTGSGRLVVLPVAFAATYGGYFGAGMGVMILAALAICLEDSLTRINALKQTISLVVNVAAAIVFMFSAETDWTLVPVMAIGALGGGALGGVVASRIPPRALRWVVVTLGISVSMIYFARAILR